MARKKVVRNISDFMGMDWTEQNPETPETYTNCDFCDKDILVTEKYFFGNVPMWASNGGEMVFTACSHCVQTAGIKW